MRVLTNGCTFPVTVILFYRSRIVTRDYVGISLGGHLVNWQDFTPFIAAGITIVVFLWKFPTKSDVNRRFAELRSEFREDIRGVREDIKDVRGEVRESIKNVREEIKSVRGEVRESIKSVRDEIKDLREEIRDVRGELKELRVAFMNYIMHRNTEDKD